VAQAPRVDLAASSADASSRAGPDPVAIVGIGCRFPGADGPEAFWTLLKDGVDAVTEMPPGRFDLDALYHPTPRTPGRIVTREGGFLANVDRFDPDFFGISPREAHFIDPQQRLLLEVSWEAFEDAGIPRERFAGTRTGVFMGVWTNEYEDRMYGAHADIDVYVTTGGARSSASGRLSYVFDLQGPSLTVDTACSSSLVAVHLACESLRRGECSAALAGGVNMILRPHVTIAFSRSGMLSPYGRCRFGDASAGGYVRSEGAGVVLLKPLSRALADGDPIYALVRGGAVNNDGRSSGLLMAPSAEGQEAMLRQAYEEAGVRPGQVQYMEAHGTGTSVGDPVELVALGRVLAEDRPKGRRCRIGSVKTNIGHAEAASGVAGLIKAALCLKHRAIPPSLHLREPNPAVRWSELPFDVPRRLEPWPEGPGPALAGVNSFGITGTNAHLILEGAPEPPGEEDSPPEESGPRLFVLSAHSPAALVEVARTHAERAALDADGPTMRDLCYTASLRRTHHAHRLATVVRDRAELAERLGAFVRGEAPRGLSVDEADPERRRRIVFVFSGHGSQWLGMSRQLQECFPVFREALERCGRAVREEAGWSPIEELAALPSRSRLDEVDVIQPALFSIQTALAALWRSWGIAPRAVVGHSMGEVAAAHVAGVLSLEDAVRVICRRSRLLRRTRGRGAMAVVELSAAEAAEALSGYEDRLSVAALNSSRSTVLSGDPAALDELVAGLEKRDVFCRRVASDVAFHSPQIEPLRADLVRCLEGLRPRPAAIPLYSTVTGETIEGPAMDPTYWARNLREPVLFSTAIERLAREGHGPFVELSPHPILLPAVQQDLRALGEDGAVLPSLRRGEDEPARMLESLGALFAMGHAVDWKALYPSGGRCLKPLAYPWQRERFWYDEPLATGGLDRAKVLPARATVGHPLLGPHLRSSVQAGTHFWETTLGGPLLPYLEDHRVVGHVILPATAFVEMALAAARELFETERLALRALGIETALLLSPSEPTSVQLVLSADGAGKAAFRISSRKAGASERDGSWTLHARGTVAIAAGAEADEDVRPVSPAELQGRCPAEAARAEHYAAMAGRGLDYGPSFQSVERVWKGDGEVLGRLTPPDRVAAEAAAYQIHPAVFDAAIQLLEAALPGPERGVDPEDTFVPEGLDRLTFFARPRPGAGLWAHARSRPAAAGAFEGDVSLFDDGGRLILAAHGVRLRRLERDAGRIDDCFFALEWEEQVLDAPETSRSDRAGRWLVLAGRSDAGRRLVSLIREAGAECVVASPGTAYENPEPGHYRLRPEAPEDYRRLLEETGRAEASFRGIVHLWSLDAPGSEDGVAWLARARELGCVSVLHLAQALVRGGGAPPRLWLVTAGAQAVGRTDAIAPAQAPLWGLGRVLANEHPTLGATNVDLGPGATDDEVARLASALVRGGREDQMALRGATTHVARLARRTLGATAGPERRRAPAGGRPFRAVIDAPGVLDNLALRAMERRAPGPGEVEIEVFATGLNFMNVMSALGIYPGRERGMATLGLECAGRIASVGEGVGLKAGDEVVAVAYDTLATHVLADARLVSPKPAGLTFEEAATLPIAFLTADYALNHLARVQPGERVLVHAAAGGVGLAAVQLVHRAGGEVFATAGSPEKRDYLQSLGVRHVMDSRSLDFADLVLERTGGEGVDVVLNSLSGEAIPRSLAVLRPYGRFLEIGKRDIYDDAPLGLGAFRKALSYFAIDLDRMIRERPSFVGGLFRDVMRRIGSGELRAIPHQAFGAGQVVEAFRHMATARHTGKIVITADPGAAIEDASSGPGFAGGTYLVTGGLGGLGLAVARWMAEKGARDLVLAGRTAPSPAASEAVNALARAGVRVHLARLDVADPAQVDDLVAEIDRTMPPLRGVVHAAGVLDDGILLEMTADRFASVMASKVEGAWNLHAATAGRPLDLFVLFSSVTSLLGSPGQGNYAAANAFLDALAAYRRGKGQPALAIQWGPWRSVGLAASRADRGERLARRGLGGLRPEEGLAALDRLVRGGSSATAVMRFEWAQWRDSEPAAAMSPLFLRLAEEGGAPTPANPGSDSPLSLRDSLLAVERGPLRQSRLESHLQERVAQVLRLPSARVDVHRPLKTLGLDSLMALELRNRLEADLGLSLSATFVFNYPTVSVLAPYLAERMGIPLTAAGAPEGPPDLQELERILVESERLSTEAMRQILDE
jgi:acyl transferase domain-containing protein/acyl carrier protein